MFTPIAILTVFLSLVNASPVNIASHKVTCFVSGACVYEKETCTPTGTNFQQVSPPANMTGRGYFVNPVWARNHTLGNFTSGDFVSVEDFYEKCTGECAEDGPIGNGICRSVFMAYGTVDYADGYPRDTYNPSWLCQTFSDELTNSSFVLSAVNSSWTNASAYNNAC